MNVSRSVTISFLVGCIASLGCEKPPGIQERLEGEWQYVVEIPSELFLTEYYDMVGLSFAGDSVLMNPYIDAWHDWAFGEANTIRIGSKEHNFEVEYDLTFLHRDTLQLIRRPLLWDDTLRLSRMRPLHDLSFEFVSFSSWFDDFDFPVLDARIEANGDAVIKTYMARSSYSITCASVRSEDIYDLQRLIRQVPSYQKPVSRLIDVSAHDWYTSLVILFENSDTLRVYGGSYDTWQYHFVIGRIRRLLIKVAQAQCDADVEFPSRPLLDEFFPI